MQKINLPKKIFNNHIITKLIIVFIFIFLLLASISIFQLYQNKQFISKQNKTYDLQQNIPTAKISPVTSITETEEMLYNIDYPYLKDNKIFTAGNQITDSSYRIYGFDYSEETNSLAFITGKKDPKNPEDFYATLDEVYIQKIGSSPSKILSINPQIDEKSGYAFDINDVKYSKDSNLIAATSHDKIYIFDKTGMPLKEITLATESSGSSKIFGHVNPRFSSDNSKVLITRGYYEGRSEIIVDINTGSITDLDNFSYIGGRSYLDWASDYDLLVYKYLEGESQNKNDFSLHTESIDGIQKNNFNLNGKILESFLYKNKLYAIFIDLENDEDNSKTNLIEIDIAAGNKKTIAEIPNKLYFDQMKYSDKFNAILAQTQDKIYLLDLNSNPTSFMLYQINATL